MKEELIKMLIEAQGKFQYYKTKYESTFWFPTRWYELAKKEDAKIQEIKKQLEYYKNKNTQ